MAGIPKRYKKFQEEYPDVANHYEGLADAVKVCGPLDTKTVSMIKLAISTGAKLEGAVHSHARKALKSGCTPEELKQVIMLAMPSLGLPSTMAAFSWLEDIIGDE
ncbi:MAG: carboxymuconolactone decarboxylase [Ignavibacteria bacterium GWF2_33_9]|nr:MAG: carboxymuconolactone decarboxylase [Ignavibacteria bacterium GWF2_33_9]